MYQFNKLFISTILLDQTTDYSLAPNWCIALCVPTDNSKRKYIYTVDSILSIPNYAVQSENAVLQIVNLSLC